MKVAETFRSLQGESYMMGVPCTFVRLAGCNLRCSWCDTTHAQDPSTGVEMTPDEILARIEELGDDVVEFTGGEPLLQPEVLPLMRTLLENGTQVLLETNGTQDLSDVDAGVYVIMDIKPPSSGCHDFVLWENLERLGPSDELKVVIADRRDYDWAKGVLAQRGAIGKLRTTFSPAYGKVDYRTLADWILADRIPVKLGIQLHRLIWGEETRGK